MKLTEMYSQTGGSCQPSPKLGGLQILHNVSATSTPAPSAAASLPNEVTKQVAEVLGLVTELKDARTLQTQQTTDIARCELCLSLRSLKIMSNADLSELNTWLEKFVVNSTTELSTMSKRLNTLVGPEPTADGQPTGPGLPDLVADVHSMMSAQKQRNDIEGMVGHRLDSLLQMMGQERERQASQQTSES